ncbi:MULTISPECIES: DUF485 domain-containing protein [Campylobacter]|uniref:Hypothetical membrane protein (DUF485 domain) n=1 Tax=Campylobacter vicugnae TaxID=1660076 RepID=A0A1X9T1B3_9BACT|nr:MULTISPECIES: DUF485 domain-containing protein [unclassified Campylobacter]ARR02300.1 hypothetical membrane protein (DUF485 domain) [Campylobacter sp. RM8964]MBE6429915.1 DUF485 domain-containing protein [Campylobacter sp.]
MKNHDILKRYAKFIAFRNIFCIVMSCGIFTLFFAFILAIGFYPDILGYKIGPSSITLGVICGVFIIAIAILSTGIYTLFANKYFDKEQSEIIEILRTNNKLDEAQKYGIKGIR